MVHSFFIQAIDSKGKSRLLYATSLTPRKKYDDDTTNKHDAKQKTGALQNKSQSAIEVHSISERVLQEYTFSESTSIRRLSEDDYHNMRDGDNFPELHQGVFKYTENGWDSVSGTNERSTEKVVVWQGGFSCIFTLVCEVNENIVLAFDVLNRLIKTLQNKAQVITQQNDLKHGRVNIIVKRLLPNGQLLFMNHRSMKYVGKEIDAKNSL
ncbi:AP-5 complex subunit sigma-1 [Nymphon striatum]|nr:AP-5 complex subunit sigma-1 [Nymphon striatum]